MEVHASHVGVGSGIATLAFGVARWAFRGYVDAQSKLLEAKDAAQARQIEDLERGLKAAWAIIDRLKDERSILWTRADHQAWEASIKADNRALRDEIRQDLKSLGEAMLSRIDRKSVV